MPIEIDALFAAEVSRREFLHSFATDDFITYAANLVIYLLVRQGFTTLMKISAFSATEIAPWELLCNLATDWAPTKATTNHGIDDIDM